MSNPKEQDEATSVYVISVAAELSGLHPQTLRQYDRIGLVSPGRAQGRARGLHARLCSQDLTQRPADAPLGQGVGERAAAAR